MADPALFKKVPLTCEVMAKTKADLEEFSETSSISVGEIIDNLVSKLSSTDPTLAAQVILESTAIAISPLNKDDTFETLVRVLRDLTFLVTKVDHYEDRLSAILRKIESKGPDLSLLQLWKSSARPSSINFLHNFTSGFFIYLDGITLI